MVDPGQVIEMGETIRHLVERRMPAGVFARMKCRLGLVQALLDFAECVRRCLASEIDGLVNVGLGFSKDQFASRVRARLSHRGPLLGQNSSSGMVSLSTPRRSRNAWS